MLADSSKALTMPPSRSILIYAFTLLTLIGFVNRAQAEAVKIDGTTMGTYYAITIDTADGMIDPAGLKKTVESRLAAINQSMSTWDQQSAISSFNRSESTDWQEVDKDFLNVAKAALTIFEASERSFDPTLDPLIQLWGFGTKRERRIPSAAAIANARKLCGMQHLEVEPGLSRIRKTLPGLRLNFSAIAKGYAVDQIAALLRKNGYSSFVVDIGGENVAGDAKRSGQPWRLGVESPLGGLNRVLPIVNQAVATSGDYRNNFRLEGKTYSHAIDPSTGWPVADPPASVTVIAKDCMTADAWATALMVCGQAKGLRLAEGLNLAVMFQTIDHGQVQTASSPQFDKLVGDTATPESANPKSIETDESSSTLSRFFPMIAAAAIFMIAIGGMAIGAILQNKSIKGSCGGLASMPGREGKSICELCTIPKDECTNADLRDQMQQAATARGDAS